MSNKKDKRQESDDYRFMKETIKKSPIDKGRCVRRILGIAAGGVLFGACAALTIAAVFPKAAEKFGSEFVPREDISLSETTPAPTVTDAPTAGQDMVQELHPESYTEPVLTMAPLEVYEGVYEDILEVAAEPRKALVRVAGISDDPDLLDNSFLSYGNEEGIVFLQNETDIYILTTCNKMQDATTLRITFCNGAVAMGTLCKSDTRTGLAVVRVPLTEVTEDTRNAIYVANLTNSYSLHQTQTVIAIGSPAGDYDAVEYGSITSVTGKLIVADGEYSLLNTDMIGSPDGGGVLLDLYGNVIGVILNQEEENTNLLRAISIAQLRPLIELLSNGEAIKYVGICGATISDAQADNLEIPKGIYVDNVEGDSPAMSAGIQSGDIIHALDGEEVKNVQSYVTKLQKLKTGQKVKISLYRRDGDREYVDMDLNVTIEER